LINTNAINFYGINKINEEYILKYEDILKLEGLGWIEYVPFHSIYFYGKSKWIQFLIESKKDSIDMVNIFIYIFLYLYVASV
jgi:hypothetical protein